jgi:hypothetical protein
MIDKMIDWSVPAAIEYMKHLVEFKPVFIEGQDTTRKIKCLMLIIHQSQPIQMMSSVAQRYGKRSSHMAVVLQLEKQLKIVLRSSSCCKRKQLTFATSTQCVWAASMNAW